MVFEDIGSGDRMCKFTNRQCATQLRQLHDGNGIAKENRSRKYQINKSKKC